jgi:hypothetical protein
MGEPVRLRSADEEYLLELVAEGSAAAPASVEDVAAAGRAAYTWLTVDDDIERCLSHAWSHRQPPDHVQRDAVRAGAAPGDGSRKGWSPCRYR